MIKLKTPTERLDYSIEYSSLLEEGETITNSAWSVPAGIDEDGTTYAGTSSKIWLQGGTVGVDYIIKNTLTTSANRIFERGFTLRVVASRP